MGKSASNGKKPHRFEKGNKEGHKFTSDYQPSNEAKKAGQLKRKALNEIKDEIVYKSFDKVSLLLDGEEITFKELMDIFKEAVKMSGFLNDKQELNIQGLQKIFITPKEVQETDEHIDNVLNEQ